MILMQRSELSLELPVVTTDTLPEALKMSLAPAMSLGPIAEVKAGEGLVFTPADTNVMSVEDLMMLTSKPGAIDEVNAVRILRHVGIDPSKVTMKYKNPDFLKTSFEACESKANEIKLNKGTFSKCINVLMKKDKNLKGIEAKDERVGEQKSQVPKEEKGKSFEGPHALKYRKVIEAPQVDEFKRKLKEASTIARNGKLKGKAKAKATAAAADKAKDYLSTVIRKLPGNFSSSNQFYMDITPKAKEKSAKFLEVFFSNEVAGNALLEMYRADPPNISKDKVGKDARCISIVSAMLSKGKSEQELCFIAMSQGGNKRDELKKELRRVCDELSTDGKILFFFLDKDPSENFDLLQEKLAKTLSLTKGRKKGCAEGPVVSLLYKLAPYEVAECLRWTGIVNLPFYFDNEEFKKLNVYIPPLDKAPDILNFSVGSTSCQLPLKTNCKNCADKHSLTFSIYQIFRDRALERFSESKLSFRKGLQIFTDSESLSVLKGVCEPMSPLDSPIGRYLNRHLELTFSDKEIDDVSATSGADFIDPTQVEFSPGDSKSDPKAESKSSLSKEVSSSEPKSVSKDDLRAEDTVSATPQAFFGGGRHYGKRSARRLPAGSVSSGPGDSKSSEQLSSLARNP